MDKLSLHRLRPHMMLTGNLSEFQSAYRSGHSTETAQLKIVNDVIITACNRQATVFLSLYISAAFDRIDHNILVDHFPRDSASVVSPSAGCSPSSPAKCSTSPLMPSSVPVKCMSSIPQNNVLGPLLFATYTSPFSNVVSANNLHYRQHADGAELCRATYSLVT